MARRTPPALIALALAITGCGGSGVSAGATVSVYVAAPLCKEARRDLRREDGEAGDLEVRVLCLAPVEPGGDVDLSTAGTNARRATEDSTSVAYLESVGPGARFSRSILEAADIAWVEAESGAGAMREVLEALGEAGSESPRDAVREGL